MRIKKILFTLSLVFIAATNVAAKNECSYSKIETLRNELKNVIVDYTVMPKGSTYTHPSTLEEVDATNKIKIQVTNVPENFYVMVRDGDYFETLIGNTAVLNSGVYNLNFYNYECGANPIYTYSIKLPYYDPTNKENVWFDGTYTPKSADYINPTKNKINVKLIVVLVLLIVIIIILAIFIIKKRRKYIRESQL